MLRVSSPVKRTVRMLTRTQANTSLLDSVELVVLGRVVSVGDSFTSRVVSSVLLPWLDVATLMVN